MKKTLLAMAALALCGTAFGLTEYTTSQMAGTFVGEEDCSDYLVYDDARVTVDSSAPTGRQGFDVQYFRGSLTVVFDGEHIWNIQGEFLYDDSLNITSTAAGAQSWLDALSAGEQITLFSNVTPGDGGIALNLNALFEGVAENGQVTLAGTELTYKGVEHNPTTLSLGDNEIAIVRMVENNKTAGYALVGGKITPAVPEPATATLSLLALAGLASRRRRK